jgi:peptide/nickel transport system permease protein
MRWVVVRLSALVPIWLGISLLAFVLLRLAPGDPASVLLQRDLGRPATNEELRDFKAAFGLDAPWPVQYVHWLSGVLRGDFGRSLRTGGSVATSIAERLPGTIGLAVYATLLAWLVGLPLGLGAALCRGSVVDHVARLLALAGATLPSFWVALLLILLFSVTLRWLPVAGAGTPQHAVLPALTLGLASAASLSRLVRAGVLEVLQAPYITTARAKGLPPRVILARHLLRNALLPVVTASGLQFGHLLGGAVIVETVFAWPGLGKLLIDAIAERDYTTLQAIVLVFGTIFVALNLALDVLYGVLDPRVREVG